MCDTQEGISEIIAHTVVCVIDRRGRVMWSSDDPLDEKGRAGSIIMDMLPASDRAILSEALQCCIVQSREATYIVHGPPSPGMEDGPHVKWRVTMLPYESDGRAAAVAICVVLPDNFNDITRDDKALLRLLCDDKTLKDIATLLDRSESAIDARVKLLKEKLGVKNLAALVASALIQHVI